MRTLKKLLSIVWLTCFLVSCNEDLKQTSKEKKLTLNGAIVLKERAPSSPLILSKRRKLKPPLKTKSEAESFSNFLGRSLKTEELPLTDYRNFGWEVIEIDDFIRDTPNSYHNDPIHTSDSKAFTYSTFSRYVQKSTINRKVKSGFSLNLGVFSIGAKHSMERTFSKTKISDYNRVFGEVHCMYKASRYWLKNSSLDIKKMKNYVAKNFLSDLYNIPSSEFLNIYGSYVLCDFIVGGKAVAFYSGLYSGNTSTGTKEKNMQTDIDASYSFKDKSKQEGKVSANIGFGKNFSNGSETTHKITDLKFAVKTLGGIGGITKANPQDINTTSVNLSSWWTSLNNSNTHSIIEISDNGLLPITEFIKEDNVKNYLLSYYKYNAFVEPKLYYYYMEPLDRDIVFLKTRFGDVVVLYDEKYISKKNVNSLIENYHEKYKIKTIDCTKELLPKEDEWGGDIGEEYPEEYKREYKEFLLEYFGGVYWRTSFGIDMKKLIHNGVTYLVSKKQGGKFAYTIHDDYILDTYGIRKWVNNMQTIQIDPIFLDEYILIAL